MKENQTTPQEKAAFEAVKKVLLYNKPFTDLMIQIFNAGAEWKESTLQESKNLEKMYEGSGIGANTVTAFKDLVSRKGWYKLCGAKPSTAKVYKHHFKKGELISEQAMKKLLLAAAIDGKKMYEFIPEQWIIKAH